MMCLDTPVFVRGGISKGEIYEGQGTSFGPALIEAYLRAERLARVPRIIIPANLIEELSDEQDKAMLDGFAYMDYDGFYTNIYIDYFCLHNSTAPFRNRVSEYIDSILSTSMDQSLRDKYLYVKSRMQYCAKR